MLHQLPYAAIIAKIQIESHITRRGSEYSVDFGATTGKEYHQVETVGY